MIKILLAATFALSLAASSLSAAEFYVGAGLGGEVESGSLRTDLESFSDASGDSWKLFAGWRIGPHLAVELGTHDLGTQRCCSGIADLGFTATVDGYSAAALGRWPLGRVTPFVKAGVLSWEEDGELVTLIGTTPTSTDGTDLLLGAGLDVDLPARFAIRAEWERYEFRSASSDSFWASLLYRF